MSVKLEPGDIIAVDPVQPGVVAGMVTVAENGEDLYFAWSPKPWTEREDMAKIGQPGLTAQEAEDVINGKRKYEGAVIYLVWKEASQTSYGIPDDVQAEIDRRQEAVAPITPTADAQNLGKITPQPIDFETPKGGMW